MSSRTSATAAPVAFFLVVGLGACSGRIAGIGCTGATRDTLTSVTHVDRATMTVSPSYDDFNRSVCGGRMETSSSESSVMEHYRAELEPDGWTVQETQRSVLQARRADMCLTVGAEGGASRPTAVYVNAGPCHEMRDYDPGVL
ncbi:hypothetical protein LL946_18230 [Knoellia locipacati]|uniref:hypothetical protein n=1 Tax=Knoellia locipacati TaxID=882824 RepID=UPI00384C0EEE